MNLKFQTVAVGIAFTFLVIVLKKDMNLAKQQAAPHIETIQQVAGNYHTTDPVQQQAWTADDVDQAIVGAFADLGARVTSEAFMVARCESSLDPYAHRTNAPKNQMIGDRGIFQLNYIHDNRLGLDSSNVFDPYVNASKARQLYDEAGGSWKDWGHQGAAWGTWNCHRLD